MTLHIIDIRDTSMPTTPDYQKAVTNADRMSVQFVEYDSTRMLGWPVVHLNRFKHMQHWSIAIGEDNMIQIHNSKSNVTARIVLGKVD